MPERTIQTAENEQVRTPEGERPRFTRLPRHVAIIMDGNGRWARARGRSRTFGHEHGVTSIREATTECCKLGGIEYLTLYALSRDNYLRRPRREISFLMRLLRRYLREELPTLQENSVKLHTIGDWSPFSKAVRQELQRCLHETADNTGLVLTLALNYGSRHEIVGAVKRLLADVERGIVAPEAVNEEELASRLDTAEMPDPDLLIRTAGEMRLSNFLLWQGSYAEFWSTDVCWPDFRKEHLWQALRDYERRERKFGGLRETGHPGLASR